jgi:hypothetical protein
MGKGAVLNSSYVVGILVYGWTRHNGETLTLGHYNGPFTLNCKAI